MIEIIIKFLVNFLPKSRKSVLVKEIYKKRTKTYEEITLLIDSENIGYRAAFSIYVQNDKKQKELIKFFGSKLSEEPKNVFFFMDEFSEEYMQEVASRHCAMMHSMKIDFALLDYKQYVKIMNHISSLKEALADHMNYVINNNLQSLDKEITQVAWEEHIADEDYLESIKSDDDLWN